MGVRGEHAGTVGQVLLDARTLANAIALLPPFLEGQTPHRFRCDQRPASARFKFLLLQVSALESASIIVKKDGI